MARILAEGASQGRRLDPLTLEACELWVATEKHGRRVAWIERQLAPADLAWRALALAIGRVEFLGHGWQLLPLEDRGGSPVIIAPCWESDPWHVGGAVCVDLVAIDGERVAARGGVAALGECEAEQALAAGEPLAWHRSALSWCRRGGNARRELGGVARFAMVDQAAPLAERVLLGARQLVAEDRGHAAELDAKIAAARRAALPRKPVLMVDSRISEAAA